MKPSSSLLPLLMLAACATPQSTDVDTDEITQARDSTPRTLTELVAWYQVQSGFNLTYDQDTATLLDSITIRPIGDLDMQTLRIASSTPGESEPKTAALPGTMEIFALKYADATEVAATLRDLVGDASEGGEVSPSTKVIADPRANSLLIQTSEARMEEFKNLIAALDQAQAG